MQLYMQMPGDTGAALRYCQLLLQQDLLGDWSLIREQGRQGQAGRIKREHFDDYASALAAMLKMRDDQLRRGFRVVYMQGEDMPE